MHDAPDVDVLHREVERLRATAEHAERKLRALDAVAGVLAGETTIDAGMPRILASLASALGCIVGGFWAPDGDGLELTAQWAAEDVDGWAAAPRRRTLPGLGLAGRVWAERSPLGVPEVNTDHGLLNREILLAAGARSGFGFPLTAGTEVVGVIELYSRQGDPLDALLTDLLRMLGARLGEFVQRAAGDARVRRQHGELELERAALERLNTVGRTISAELDHRKLAQVVVDAATELTGAQYGAFFYSVTDDRIDSYLVHAVSGLPREAFAKLGLPRNTAILAPAFLGHGSVRLADVTQDPRYGKNYPHKGVPEGHPVVRSYLAVPVVSRDGSPIGGMFLGHPRIGVFSERSERTAIALAAQAATAMDNARLYDEAQRLIADLEKANAELDQFAYAASHDLRAPLRGISNLASWIDEDLPDTTDPTTKEHLRLLKTRAARMDRLIHGLLELARVGRARQKPARVDVTELLHETIEIANPPEAARIMMIGEMPMLVTERAALQQVFLHLIANALQHSGRDDVVVRISAIDRGDEWELAIADNGAGIPREHHARVWQLFQTLQSRDIVESTGIGLAIVRKQVESNGGRVWIDPTAPSGTTIRFTWPKRTK
ncbi:MAG TPA: GAF domain-containing protein [Kofleriaceae bacterium]